MRHAILSLLVAPLLLQAQAVREIPGTVSVPVQNASFEEGLANGVPVGWQAYKDASPTRRRELVPVPGGQALRLVDEDAAEEIGVQQTLPAEPGLHYQLSVQAKAAPDAPTDSFYLQLRFLPSNRLAQKTINPGDKDFATTQVALTAPADTTHARIYIYSSRPAVSTILVDGLRLGKVKILDIAELDKVRPRTPETPLANLAVVAAKGDGWDEAASELLDLLEKTTGKRPPMVSPESCTHGMPATGIPVLLGNVNNNRAFLFPYSHRLCFADDLVPGPGGYEVRTVHNPLGDGRNMILVGASDPEGAKRGVRELAKLLRPGMTALPPVFSAKFEGEAATRWGRVFTDKLDGKWQKQQQDRAERGLATGVHTGLFGYAGGLGTNYALSHRPEYAEMFVWMIQRAYEHYLTKPTTYGGPWGMDSDFRIYSVFPAWDAVEECPALTDTQRLEVTKILYRWVSDLAHKGVARGTQVRFNHITFPALGCHFAGEYYWNHYQAWQGQLWLDQAKEVFDFQSQTTKPHCDCNSYQWLTLHHVMLYNLAIGRLDYFESGRAEQNARYLIQSMNNLGYQVPHGDVGGWQCWGSSVEILRKAYWYGQNPEIGWALRRKLELRASPELGGYTRTLGNVSPPREVGVVVSPLPKPWYDTFARAGDAPFPSTFDKITFRNRFDDDSAYVLLDGLARGGHGHHDANAILQWTQNGRIWLVDTDYIKSLPKYHDTLLILRDGQSAPIPTFAELLRAATLPQMGISSTRISDYAGADWTRTIFWLEDDCFVVVDRVEAREEGDYSIRSVWQTLGECHLENGALDVEQHGQYARIAISDNAAALLSQDREQAKNWNGYPHVDDPTVQVLQGVMRARLRPGQSRCFATLLQASGKVPSALRLRSLGDGTFAVLGGRAPMLLAVGDDKDRIDLGQVGQIGARAFALTPSQAWGLGFRSVSNPAMYKQSPQPLDLAIDIADGQVTMVNGLDQLHDTWELNTVPAEVAEAIAGVVEMAPMARKQAETEKTATALVPVWSFLDRPAGYLVTANAGAASRADAGLQVAASPQPLEANAFNGKPGENTTANLFDGALVGVPAATQWAADQEVTLDLTFAQPVELLSCQVEAWFATSSSKGDIFQLARIRAFAGTGPDDLKLLADQSDDKTYPNWGSPIRHELPLSGTARQLRLVLTPRPGTGVYLAELRVFGKGAWLDERRLASKQPGDPYLCAVLDDLDGDGRQDAALGSMTGRLLRLDDTGKILARMDCRRAVRSLAAVDFAGDGMRTLVAGGDDATVFAFAPDGKQLWEYAVPRYKKTGVVRVLAPMSTPKGTVVLAGADNWRFHALDAKGQYLWHVETVHTSTAACVADLKGKGTQDAVLGTSYYWWTTVDNTGKQLWRYRTRGGPGCNVIAAADLDGNGTQEVLFGGEDTLVQAASSDGQPLWQFNTGDEVTGLLCTDLDGNGSPEVVASSLSFNVYALDSKGAVVWRTDLGAPVSHLALLSGPALAVACADGTVAVLDAGGKVIAHSRVSGAPLALAARGNQFLVTDDSGRATLFAAP